MNKRITNMILCFCILLTFFVPVYQQINLANPSDNSIVPYDIIIKTDNN